MSDVNMLLEPLRAFLVQVGAFLPRVAVAIVVLIVGWLIAKALRFAAVRALRAINFNVLTERAGIDAFLQQGGLERDTTAFVGALVYWLVILGALVIAANGLGLSYVTDLLMRVFLFLPRLFVALLVIVFGAYFARFVNGAVQTYCRNVDMQDAELLGRIAQYAILVFVILIALEQLAIGGDIVRYTFLILLAGVVLALAIAFGLGGRQWAEDLLQRWWPTRRREDDDAPGR
ncbi:MAG: hypothetical protein OHK0044_32480 [Burkholderiaceae bacterium]